MTAEVGLRLRGPLLIDGHVHIHSCFDLDTFFSSALANFRESAVSMGLSPLTAGCLMLAETPREEAFGRARQWLATGGNGDWTLQPTHESISLIGRSGDGGMVVVIAGQQVATYEGLEVLGLGMDRDLPFDLRLEDTVHAVSDAGGIPVLPWGFGKWWFERGKRVMELLASPPVSELFLGDNAGRPRVAKTPAQFSLALERGISVLPGTDPLPLPSHGTRVGGYGFVLEGPWDSRVPGKGIKQKLRAAPEKSTLFGRRSRLPFVIRSQLELRFSRMFNREDG